MTDHPRPHHRSRPPRPTPRGEAVPVMHRPCRAVAAEPPTLAEFQGEPAGLLARSGSSWC